MPKTKTAKSRAYKSKKSFRFKWWMALILIVIIGGIGLVILRFSEASTSVAPKGPIYWIGDSLSTGMVTAGDLANKLEKNGYNPAYINQNPGRSLTGVGFANQDAFAAVDANNKNVCPGATIQSIVNYCKQHQQKYNPVADAKTVVIFLGTNPELSTNSFSSLQKDLIDKIRSVNPSAKIIWGDIASPGNHDLGLEGSLNWERFFTGKPLTPGSPEYVAFVDNFNRNFDTTRKRLQNNLYMIYKNSTALNYGVISQFKFLWGENTPIDQLIEKTNQKDPNGYLNADGVHYEAIGSQRLADYFVARLNDGRLTRVSSLPTAADLTSSVINFQLTNPPNTFTLQQSGGGSGCVKQIGFKENRDFRGCNITSTTPITILPANSPTKSILLPNTKLKVCVGSVSTSTNPLNVVFQDRSQAVAVARLEFGTEGPSRLKACGTTNLTVSEIDKIIINSTDTKFLTNFSIERAP